MIQKSVAAVRLNASNASNASNANASHVERPETSQTGRSGEHAIRVPRPLPKPATMVELDESVKRLQRVITGSDDTGQWSVPVDADRALGR